MTTLRGSVGIAVAADDDRQPDEFGVAPQFDRGQELVEVDVQDPSRGAHRVPQSLRATLSHASPRLFKCLAAFGELVVHVVGVEQREQGGRPARRGRRWCPRRPAAPECGVWCSVAGALNRICGSRLASDSSAWWACDELQPVAAVGQQSLQRRRTRAQRRRAEQERLLLDLLVLVEQHDHQPGPAAEPAEQRALADAGGRGDVVRGDRVGAALGDQPARGVEQ